MGEPMPEDGLPWEFDQLDVDIPDGGGCGPLPEAEACDMPEAEAETPEHSVAGDLTVELEEGEGICLVCDQTFEDRCHDLTCWRTRITLPTLFFSALLLKLFGSALESFLHEVIENVFFCAESALLIQMPFQYAKSICPVRVNFAF